MFKRIAQKLTKKNTSRQHQEPEQIEMKTIQPRLEPDPVPETEPGRPYQGYVESEAREYWQEISKVGGLTTPARLDIQDGIRCLALWNRSSDRLPGIKPGSRAMRSRLKAGTGRVMDPEQPYQDFVEDEARKYWQETGKEHNLTKPTQQEIRTAAMPILCRALRNRFGSRRHRSVAAVVQHAYESGLLRRPFSDVHESPSYIDALIQLADDAHWLAFEIPLPAHSPPYHPPVYYTINFGPEGPVPVPREDALLRGDYFYKHTWSPSPVIKNDCFYPSSRPLTYARDRDILDQGRAYYSLVFMPVRGPINCRLVDILFHWKDRSPGTSIYYRTTIDYFHFSSHPPDWLSGRLLP